MRDLTRTINHIERAVTRGLERSPARENHTSRQDRPLHGVHPQLMSNIPNGRASPKDKSVTLDPAVVTALPAPDPAFHPQRPRQDWSDRYPLVVGGVGGVAPALVRSGQQHKRKRYKCKGHLEGACPEQLNAPTGIGRRAGRRCPMGIALRRCTQRWCDVVPRRLLGGQEHAEASVLGQPCKLWIERRLRRCLGLRRRKIFTGYFWYFDLRVSGRPEGRGEINIHGLDRDWPYRITCEGNVLPSRH